MAVTLESLSLEVNASAKGASSTIDSLISSLNALDQALTNPIGKLKELKRTLNSMGITSLAALKRATDVGTKVQEQYKPTELAKPDPRSPSNHPGQSLIYNNGQFVPDERTAEAISRAKQQAEELLSVQREYTDLMMKLKPGEEKGVFQKVFGTDSMPNAADQAQQIKNFQALTSYLKDATGTKQIEESAPAIKETAQALQEVVPAAKQASSAIKETAESSKKASGGFSQIKNAIKDFAGNIAKSLPKLKLFHRIMRMATTMLIRSGIKKVFKDVKEGFLNFYQYSKATGGQFAQQMDSVSSAFAQMRNQLGAAVAPAISAIIPVLNSIANAAITAFNALSQLFALLTGKSSWHKATAQVAEFAAETNKASGSGGGGGMKELLAQFDELNVIASESGGGGGGAGKAAEDYADMFEEMTNFDAKLIEIANKVKEIVGWIQDHMEDVLTCVGLIGAAIALWNISQALSGALATIAGLASAAAVITITCKLVSMFDKEYLKTGQVGWLIADALTTAVGATIAGGIVASILKSPKAGLYTAAFTLALSGITTLSTAIGDVNTEGLNDKHIKLALLGALKIGGAAALAAKVLGATVGVAALAGTITTGLVFAAAVGIMALIDAGRMKFEWGNVQLTEQEVQEFVSKKMFNVDLNTTMNIITENVQMSESEVATIKQKWAELRSSMKDIRLDIADDEDYKRIADGVDGLITEIKKHIATAQRTGQLTLEFTPTLVGETEGDQNSWYSSYKTGWDKVEKFFENQGKKIAKCFVEAENGEIKLRSPEVLQTLMAEMDKVTSAITNSKIASEAYGKFAITMGDLSAQSAESVAKAFGEYKNQLTEKYTELVNQQYAQQGQLVAALFELDPNSKEYKDALSAYEYMGEHLTESVKNGVSNATESGRKLVMDWLTGKLGKISAGAYAGDAWKQVLDANNITPEALNQAMKTMFRNMGVPDTVISIMDLVEISGWDFLDNDLKKSMIATVTEAIGMEAVPMLKSSLKISANDMLSIGWDQFKGTQRLQFISAITSAYGATECVQAAKAAGINIAKEITAGLGSQDAETRKTAQQLLSQLQSELKSKNIEVPVSTDVEANVTAVVDAVVNVTAKSETAKITSVASALKSAYAAASTIAANLSNKVKGSKKATGAFGIPSGDVFVANDQGAELIGSLNGKTTVANQEQIVEGIRRGLEGASEQQNRLLQQQNDLLRQLLEKDSSVRIGASAALGRVVAQSQQMYARQAGG